MPYRLHTGCKVPGCVRKHKARGYCQTHYTRKIRGMSLRTPIQPRDYTQRTICVIKGCSGKPVGRGLCGKHHARFIRHGTTKLPKRPKFSAKPCSIVGCKRPHNSNGLCDLHYQRAYKALKRFGLTLLDVQALLNKQDGVCAICKRPETKANWLSDEKVALCLDHDHETGEVRGLLCDCCNRALGLLGDDAARTLAAHKYLRNARLRVVRSA